jgi:hypothetical protein
VKPERRRTFRNRLLGVEKLCPEISALVAELIRQKTVLSIRLIAAHATYDHVPALASMPLVQASGAAPRRFDCASSARSPRGELRRHGAAGPMAVPPSQHRSLGAF